MSFTTLKVDDNGVLLYVLHEERFRMAGDAAVAAYRQFAAGAASGNYNLYWDNKNLLIKARGESRLVDGMPVRYRVSPIANLKNRIDKPAPPSIYSDLVESGLSTMLTSADGNEMFESCSAAVIAWNGKNIIRVPDDRPAVRSTMEGLLKIIPGVIEEPILKDSTYPIALVNALKCVCTLAVEGRDAFPVEQLDKIREFYLASSRRT
jgi:hypothetical protein